MSHAEEINKPTVFIGGYYRSGTSLLRALLGSHSKIAFIPFDLPLWTWLLDDWINKDFSVVENRIGLAQAIATHSKYLKSDTRVEERVLERKFIASGEDTYGGLIGEFLEQHCMLTGKCIPGHKCPNSERNFDVISSSVRNPKFLQLVRDPRSVAESFVHKESFGELELGTFFSEWGANVGFGVECSRLQPDQFMVVKYESLVAEPDLIVSQICDFIGIDFEVEMMQMQGHSGWSGSNSSFGGKRQETSVTNREGAWTTRMKDHEIAQFQLKLGSELRLLEYPIRQINLPARIIARLQGLRMTLHDCFETSLDIFLRRRGAFRSIPFLVQIGRVTRKLLRVSKKPE
ncbi:sulfotransferase [Akkermansiaceae bacterium]|nr:sulfotransferase [Akkermansiaceae bacterium]MDB4480607.1 sulfotransferase [Akkermansiaceae bacterium]